MCPDMGCPPGVSPVARYAQQMALCRADGVGGVRSIHKAQSDCGRSK